MNTIKTFSCLVIVSLFFSCSQQKKLVEFSIKNTQDFERTFETVEIKKSALKTDDLTAIGIKDIKTGTLLVTQLVDNDGDGTMDELLFQPKIAANTTANFEVVSIKTSEKPTAPELCYSRFVPERTDDYTWENNKVAFRVYGPVAQKMIEE